MKARFIKFLLASLVVLAVVGCDRPSQNETPQTGSTDPNLYGVWRVVGIGEKKLASTGLEVRWTISDTDIAISNGEGEEISRSVYYTDTSYVPHHITMEIRDSDTEDRPGIYKISGNALQMTFSLFGEPRPQALIDSKPMDFERIIDPNQ